jgi:hypothetical protein
MVKIKGLGVFGGQVVKLLLRSDFGAVAEQAVYIDKELLIDCAAGNIYFFENDGSDWWESIPIIKKPKKYIWPGE